MDSDVSGEEGSVVSVDEGTEAGGDEGSDESGEGCTGSDHEGNSHCGEAADIGRRSPCGSAPS